MPKSLNKVLLIGNLGKDPEVKYTPSGVACATVTLATNERYKDKKADEWKESVEWHTLVFWRNLAEIVGKHLKKGSRIHVEGKIVNESWEHKGEKYYRTKIHVRDMIMLDGRAGSGESGPQEEFDREITDEDIPF